MNSKRTDAAEVFAAQQLWHAARPVEAMQKLTALGCNEGQRRYFLTAWGVSADDAIDFAADSYLVFRGATESEDTMSNKIRKADPADAGCWIDGHWGHYGTARMVEIAAQHGYVDTAAQLPFATLDVVACAASVLRSMGPSGHEAADEEWNCLDEACDDVEVWLNENIAPEGYSFGWHDGEFFLWSDESWSEECY